MDKNLPADAGGRGSIPGPGTLHMSWSNQACESQLPSLSVTTNETHVPRACALQQEKSLQ